MYASKAKEAQVNAEASKDEQARQSWLRIAEGYLNLARHAEKSRLSDVRASGAVTARMFCSGICNALPARRKDHQIAP